MKNDPIELSSVFLRHSGRRVSAHQVAPDEAVAPFIDNGWLTPAGLPDTVPCEACDEAHPAEVATIDATPHAVCSRTGETFPITARKGMYRVEGGALTRDLSTALGIREKTRLASGFSQLWRLGACRLRDTRIVVFFAPDLDRLDLATSVLNAVNDQAKTFHAILIVASDRLDHVELVNRKCAVVRLRDVADIEKNGGFIVDTETLADVVLPEPKPVRGLGAPATQREKIIPILDEMEAAGTPFDRSNEVCKVVQERNGEKYGGSPPAKSTIRDAAAWLWTSRSE